MSIDEQDGHLGELLVEQRRHRGTAACLKSKIERIYETLADSISSRRLLPLVTARELLYAAIQALRAELMEPAVVGALEPQPHRLDTVGVNVALAYLLSECLTAT